MAMKQGLGRAVLLGLAVLLAPGSGHAGAARERRLHLVSAEASSYLVNDWNRFQENYLPLYVGDDDPHTAWNLKTEGIGEWIRMHVTSMQGATHVRMKIRNGFQKSEKLFAANSRAHTLTVVLLPSKKTIDVELTDRFGWQEIAVDQPAGPLDAVELHVKAVYPGKKYDDLCLSDVQLYVTATSSDNPAYEKQHFEKIVTWKEERAAAAALFKTAMGKTLPLAPQDTVTNGRRTAEPDRAGGKGCNRKVGCWMESSLKLARATDVLGSHVSRLETATMLAHTEFAAMTPVRISVQDKRPIPRVDGLCRPSLAACEEDPCEQAVPVPMTGQTGYLRADALALIEQTGLPSVAEVGDLKPAQCRTEAGGTFSWALRDNASDAGTPRVRAVLLSECGLVEGREGSYPTARFQLLVYGESGQLEVISDADKAAVLEWDQSSHGPKLAGARLASGSDGYELTVKAADAVAAR
jgi:hypothetical protein